MWTQLHEVMKHSVKVLWNTGLSADGLVVGMEGKRGNRGWVLSFRLQQWGGWWYHLWRWENEQGSMCLGEREVGIREKGRGTPGSLLLVVSLRYLLDIQLDTAHGPPAVQGELRARRWMFGSGGHMGQRPAREEMKAKAWDILVFQITKGGLVKWMCPKESLGRHGHGLPLFSEYLLRAVVEAGDTSTNRTNINPCPHWAFVLLRGHSKENVNTFREKCSDEEESKQ